MEADRPSILYAGMGPKLAWGTVRKPRPGRILGAYEVPKTRCRIRGARIMDNVIPRLYATAPQPLSFAPSVGVRSFLLERDEGNLLVYSSNTVKQEVDYIREKGGVW